MIQDLVKISKKMEKLRDRVPVELSYDIANIIAYHRFKYPIYTFTIGSKKSTAPVLFITGGVHGLEKIGAQLAWSLLKTTLDKLQWDRSLQQVFESIRMVFIPLLNPVGYIHQMRSNGNGVDLMRNSPIAAETKVPFLLGGQRLSNKLPWYQGIDQQMEIENLVLQDVFLAETKNSACVISVDLHSGFGLRDRIWFPFSYKQEPFDDIAPLYSLFSLFEQTYPYHVYHIEPQSFSYMMNGDMWDYLYIKWKEHQKKAVFIPLTLEMGSWNWVRKNPWQLFTRGGIFNPIKEHRLKRTYRRHHLFFDFLLRALHSHPVWSSHPTESQEGLLKLAKSKWYKQ